MTKERETHLNMISEDRSHWVVFTDDPVMIKLFESKGYARIKGVGLGFEYKLPADKLEFKSANKNTREFSAEELERRRVRMQKYHAEKRNKYNDKSAKQELLINA